MMVKPLELVDFVIQCPLAWEVKKLLNPKKPLFCRKTHRQVSTKEGCLMMVKPLGLVDSVIQCPLAWEAKNY
jgi:hypothetical protein